MFKITLDSELWDQAVCTTTDPETFFDHAYEKVAVRICSSCPIVALCADYALKNRIEDGVWGGLTEKQRREMLLAAKRNYRSAPKPSKLDK